MLPQRHTLSWARLRAPTVRPARSDLRISRPGPLPSHWLGAPHGRRERRRHQCYQRQNPMQSQSVVHEFPARPRAVACSYECAHGCIPRPSGGGGSPWPQPQGNLDSCARFQTSGTEPRPGMCLAHIREGALGASRAETPECYGGFCPVSRQEGASAGP